MAIEQKTSNGHRFILVANDFLQSGLRMFPILMWQEK